MAKVITLLLVAIMLFSCATDLTSKYDSAEYNGCLICDIADKRGVRLEDVGNGIRIAGFTAREMDAYTASQAIEVLEKIKTALQMPISGATLIVYLGDLQAEYAEVLSIAMSYAGDFGKVTQTLDEMSVDILLKFINERLAVLHSYD
jgi:hypothetical protein